MMIKGVSKKIVEINNPDSIYFEKAILYLRPHMGELSDKIIAKEAEKYLFSVSEINNSSSEKNRFKTAFPFICIALSVAVLIAGSIYSLYN